MSETVILKEKVTSNNLQTNKIENDSTKKQKKGAEDKDKAFECSICKRRFEKKWRRNTHYKTHNHAKNCEKCGNKMHSILGICVKNCQVWVNKKAEVKLMSKTEELKFKCEICDKRFLKSQYLDRHRAIHTGQKPFKCPVCDQSFYEKEMLNHHKLSHTICLYKCNLCGELFKQKYDYELHKAKKLKKNANTIKNEIEIKNESIQSGEYDSNKCFKVEKMQNVEDMKIQNVNEEVRIKEELIVDDFKQEYCS